MTNVRQIVQDHLTKLSEEDEGKLYHVRYYDPPMMDISGDGQHYEVLLTKWNGKKYETVASGSMQRVAEQLGLIKPR